jgi:CHAT domain-containing protein
MSSWLLSFVATALAQQVTELKQGTTLERSLKGGESHEYRIHLDARQFFDAVVEQEGIDVEVILAGPDGKQIGHIDSPNSEWGPEPMVAISATEGEYRLRVASGNQQSNAGKYLIQVKTIREATRQDSDHVMANRLFERAQDLLAQGTGESLKAAAEQLQSALPLYKAERESYAEGITLFTLGLVSAQAGDFQAAIRYDEECLPIFRSLHDSNMQGSTLINVGGAHDVLGDGPAALGAYLEALPLLQARGEHVNEAVALNNIGKIYADMADWQKASGYYQQALPIFQAAGESARAAITLTNLGTLNYLLGDNGKALEYYQRALPLHRAARNQHGEADTLLQAGSVYRALDNMPEAKHSYEQALALDRAIGDHWREGNVLRLLGAAYSATGEQQKALESLQQSRSLLHAANDARAEGLTLYVLGNAYRLSAKPQDAVNSYQQSLALLQHVGDRDSSAKVLLGLARVERNQSQLSDARQHAEQALALIEQVRSHAGAQEERASYFATQHDAGEFYIDLLMRMHKQDSDAGHDAEAFQAAERARARSLLEMLAEARVDFRRGVDPNLLAKEHEFSGLLSSKSQRLLMLRGAGSQEKADALKKEISDLEDQYRQLELEIRKNSPEYAAITQPEPLTLKEVQQQVLDSDSLLLEYSLGEERSYLFVVSGRGLKTFELPGRAKIDDSVRQVDELLTARSQYKLGESAREKQARIAAADREFPAAAASLSKTVLGPAAGELGDKRLVLVADGALQTIPFAVLPIPNATAATPLVAQHELVSLPSASTVDELRKEIAGRQPAPDLVAVFADPVFAADDPRVRKSQTSGKEQTLATAVPASERDDDARMLEHLASGPSAASGRLEIPRLPFTREEAARIAALAPANQTFEALDFRASLKSVSSGELSRYRYVHFATHGYLDSDRPELSSIVLSLVDQNGGPQDGFLRAQDIYNLKLNADLVVLSACQTGLGKQIRGEGIVGLTRGFMYAGAPRVIVSMWSVNDRATEELMAAFYQKLLKDNMRPSAALRQAQLEMWKSRKWSAPYYWGAFIQQGEWR